MYASFASKPKELLFSDLPCISMAVPGDAIGVEPKWKYPLHAAHAESLGLCLQGLTIITAKSTWSISLQQCEIGNSGGSNAVVDLKQAL